MSGILSGNQSGIMDGQDPFQDPQGNQAFKRLVNKVINLIETLGSAGNELTQIFVTSIGSAAAKVTNSFFTNIGTAAAPVTLAFFTTVGSAAAKITTLWAATVNSLASPGLAAYFADLYANDVKTNQTGAAAVGGLATLVAGTVTVATTKVGANSLIFLQGRGNTAAGDLDIQTITAGTSFVIRSANGADARVIAWQIINPQA